VYDGWVPPDSPEPKVLEIGGSTMAAAWVEVSDVRSGSCPVTPMVTAALSDQQPSRRQRVAAYAWIQQAGAVLLTRVSAFGAHPGQWTLPGGGLDHGEPPARALAREIGEECGLEAGIGALLGVHDQRLLGTAPTGRLEDFHGVHLIYAADVAPGAEPRVAESGGTTDAVAWVSLNDVASGLPVLDLVRHAAACLRPGTE
jgi:8-oxo-dGTP diphosphatase